MSSQPSGCIFANRIQISLASLADAADAFSQAAIILAAAARATAEALSGETQRPESQEESHGINLGRGSDVDFEITPGDKPDPNTPGRQDLDIGAGEESSTVAGAGNGADIRPVAAGTAERDMRSSKQINPPYRLLVDSEADVLLFVCALIDKRQKVVCYMPCGIPSLKAYKRLMENVTEIPTYNLNPPTSPHQDQACIDFLESQAAVLLVPETLSPQFEIEGENSWVIHVGWPSNETQYTVQREAHKAHNNILVAYSRDQSLYPSGDSIINQTELWPKDGASFRASVAISRPLYEVMLSEISLEMKSLVYLDWIQMHGIHGPRHVEAWTPSMVVQRANAYLLKVLQWSGEHTGGNDIPLPEVSREFITQNNLESAVLEGILQVEDLDSEAPRPSPSLATMPDSIVTQVKFQTTTGHTYFALDEEFDTIPLICFISEQYDKVICFLEGQAALHSYQTLFSKITGRLAISPTAPNNNRALEEAVLQFLSASSPAILLLAYNTTNLPP
ncbi:hypothetical protein FRC11_005061, partial [Ceratobasidium sp. 423]